MLPQSWIIVITSTGMIRTRWEDTNTSTRPSRPGDPYASQPRSSVLRSLVVNPVVKIGFGRRAIDEAYIFANNTTQSVFFFALIHNKYRTKTWFITGAPLEKSLRDMTNWVHTLPWKDWRSQGLAGPLLIFYESLLKYRRMCTPELSDRREGFNLHAIYFRCLAYPRSEWLPLPSRSLTILPLTTEACIFLSSFTDLPTVYPESFSPAALGSPLHPEVRPRPIISPRHRLSGRRDIAWCVHRTSRSVSPKRVNKHLQCCKGWIDIDHRDI